MGDTEWFLAMINAYTLSNCALYSQSISQTIENSTLLDPPRKSSLAVPYARLGQKN